MKKLLSVLSSTLQGGVRGGLLLLALLSSVHAIYAIEVTIDNLKYRLGNETATMLQEDLTSKTSFNKFTTQSVSGAQTWKYDSKYGAKMNGYVDKTYANEDWLVSPAIDLSNYTSATLTFSHAFGPASAIPTTSAQKAQYTVWVSNDFKGDVKTATWTELPISYGTSAWSYILTEVNIPTGNLQENCCIAWKYVCEDASATWEIGIVSISATANLNEAEVIDCDDPSDDPYYRPNSDYDYYSVEIPSEVTYNGVTYRVGSIGKYAFNSCIYMLSVTIPNSITSVGDRAFYGCSELTSVTIPDSVTSIGNGAFEGCSDLRSVTIPNSVTSIGDYTFYNCSELTSMTIPNSVTSIGEYAFEYCSSLRSVTIPDSVTSIGNGAFEGCFSLRSVTIPNSVTSIGYGAFAYCSSLTSVTIPNSVKSIGTSAFQSCSSLTSVTLTANSVEEFCKGVVNSILYNAGISCKRRIQIGGKDVVNITIPNSITSVGDRAFYGCSKLTSVTIPNSVTSIGNSAFYDCSSLTSLTIGNGVTSIEDYAFYGCSKLTSVTIPNSVTSIGDYAFDGCSSLTSVTIPNSVTSIGEAAFRDCSSLTSLTIGNGVTSIGNYAFYGCSKLTSVTIPNSVTTIRQATFRDCSSLISVTIGNSVKSIGTSAFQSCSSLTSLTIGESVTKIVQAAFRYCSSLSSIICKAETPPSVGSYAFQGVSATIPVYVPCGCADAYKATSDWNGFTNILEPMVEHSIKVYVNDTIMGTAKVDINNACGAQISATPNFGYHFVQWSDGNTDNPRTLLLTHDTILTAEFALSLSGQCGDNLYWELNNTTLHIEGSGAMYSYTPDTVPWKLLVSSIKELTIAEDVTSIDREAFSACPALESLVWNAKNYAIPANKEAAPFFDICSQIKSITFGEAVKHIPAYLCSGMVKLTTITIPNSLSTIGTSAFEGCTRLGELKLGINVEEIAAKAFAGCTRLYDIYCYATYPPFADASSFANYNVYLYVPCENQRDYILDIVWGEFKFIECIESEETTTDGNVTVDPGYNDVTITWPTEGNADTYTIVIKKDGEVVCTLTFNAEGQLLNIAFAPSRDGYRPAQYAEQAVNGYRFTVTGLEEATHYAYNIDVKNAANNTIKSHSGEFTTMGDTTTAVEDVLQNSTNCQKLLRDNQLLILRDGVEYTIMGAEIK